MIKLKSKKQTNTLDIDNMECESLRSSYKGTIKQMKKLKFKFELVKAILISLLVIACLILIPGLYAQFRTEDKNILISDMQKLLDKDYYNSNYDIKLKHNQLTNFSFDKDKLGFRNFGSSDSTDGVCLGFSAFEKLNYMNKLKDTKIDINGKKITFGDRMDLSKFVLSNEEINSIYPEVKSSDKNYIPDSKDIKKLNAKDIYNKSINKNDTLQNFEPIIKEKNISDIFNSINYLQFHNDQIGKQYITHTYVSDSILSSSKDFFATIITLFDDSKHKISYTLNIDNITNMIDKDEPVIIGLAGSNGGHAVLGYKYQYVDKNTMKLYVSDSNLPLLKEGDSEHINKVNTDIKNNFILFTRNSSNDKWQYIYSPKINNQYLYSGRFNSYIPGSFIAIQ